MAMKTNATLVVEQGMPDQGAIHLDKPFLIFGKSSSVDVNVDNVYVSRRHFQIHCKDEVFFVVDLDSTNGTFLNGEKLDPQGERRLRDKDVITLAGEQVVFRFNDPVMTLSLNTHSLDPHPSTAQRDLPVADLVVDAGSRDVWVRGEKLEPSLSRKEFDILELLQRNRGNAVSRDEIASIGWPERLDGVVSPEEIDQYIRRLRLRIEESPSTPRIIVTIRGYGYRIP
ncbi:MAG: hypothetical protein BZY81_07040 [SAR202 cluster bacterium Io17-Chloro-G4]|nr:MAG: hypothetical protein BZY81_07040 [SAR202 cluster bacterium Io17-Chloro-G4]